MNLELNYRKVLQQQNKKGILSESMYRKELEELRIIRNQRKKTIKKPFIEWLKQIK